MSDATLNPAPTPRRQNPNQYAVRVQFVCGYGATAADVPRNARLWMLMFIGTAYKHRESLATGVTVTVNATTGNTGGDAAGDQRRTLSAPEALRAGATWLVIGRPIYADPNPRAAAERILASLR